MYKRNAEAPFQKNNKVYHLVFYTVFLNLFYTI